MSVPESLQEKIELFRRNGTVLQDPADLFNAQSWIAVMLGQGITPASHDPLADSLSQESVRKFARHIRGLIASTAAAMPLHEDFVDEHCATHAPSAIHRQTLNETRPAIMTVRRFRFAHRLAACGGSRYR
jgi:tryptophan halogenase